MVVLRTHVSYFIHQVRRGCVCVDILWHVCQGLCSRVRLAPPTGKVLPFLAVHPSSLTMAFHGMHASMQMRGQHWRSTWQHGTHWSVPPVLTDFPRLFDGHTGMLCPCSSPCLTHP